MPAIEARPDAQSPDFGVPVPPPGVAEHCEKVMTASKKETGLKHSGLGTVRGIAKHYVKEIRDFATKTASLAPLVQAARKKPGSPSSMSR